jgi:hypothetical protein
VGGGIALLLRGPCGRKAGRGREHRPHAARQPQPREHKAFPEKAAKGAARVEIGSRVAAGGIAAPAAAAAAPTVDDQLKSFKARLAADANFRLARAEDVLPIARAARAAGDSKAAVAAVRGFDKAFPGHALIPDVFVFSAKVLAEDFKNNDMARKILEHVIARYPGHYLAQEARNYLKEMPQVA